MKKYIGLLLLLCMCLLGGCAEEKGTLAFLEEYTQEELDAYLLGRTRDDLWEEFGESLHDFEPNEDTKEYWEVNEFYGKNLRVEYDENFVVISCEVYTYKSGADFLPYYLLAGMLFFIGIISFIAIIIPLLCVIGRKRKTKARVFGILGILALACRSIIDFQLVDSDSMAILFLIVYACSFLTIPYTVVGVIFMILDVVKNGLRNCDKINCGMTVFLIIYIVVRTILSPESILWVLFY